MGSAREAQARTYSWHRWNLVDSAAESAAEGTNIKLALRLNRRHTTDHQPAAYCYTSEDIPRLASWPDSSGLEVHKRAPPEPDTVAEG